ncbi:MAG: Phenylalanyl-tRNA synthetase beta chain [Nitrosopumilales archaeon]|nr:MAG: Phenylalanyl-tRNA synthetase beta chain [Nitrosopumilales archaeon]
MPVVQLYHNRLHRLVGKKINKNKIISLLPFLGLDIEEQTNDYIRVEYSPNRPDYATDFGIALGLQGISGSKKGMQKLEIKKGDYSIKVDSSVRKVRPFVSAIVAKNGTLDDETIRQLITLQEDLHDGIGRRRKKTSIGIHDLDKISFPIKYTTTSKNHKFVPLDEPKELSISDILENTDVGKQYGAILGNSTQVPIILDSEGKTISFPPITNSANTIVSKNTKNILVEVTAIDKRAAEDTLSVVASTLQVAGFQLFSVKISGANNSTPLLKTKKMNLDVNLINKVLGLNLSSSAIASSLRKSRLDAVPKKNKIICTIPRFRFDIFGPMDLVEEVALGYGIENLKPSLPSSTSVGKKNGITKQLDLLSSIMVGLGYTEALNSSLISKLIQNELTRRTDSNAIQVIESKSQENTILRDALIPGLLENLSKNIHEIYPQKLFEIGTIFSKGDPIEETLNLACVSTHKDANFTEIKSIIQSALKTGFNIECKTKTSSHPMFLGGRTAEILVKNKSIGLIGEIDKKVIENFKIRVPVIAFEIKLTGLIFD